MKTGAAQYAGAVAICAYAAATSLEILQAWQHSPYDRTGWIAFLLWIALFLVLSAHAPHPHPHPRLPLLVAALALAFLGQVGELNALGYAALAVGMAAFPTYSPGIILLLAASLTWMPALGWLASRHTDPTTLGWIRPALAAIALAGGVALQKHFPNGK